MRQQAPIRDRWADRPANGGALEDRAAGMFNAGAALDPLDQAALVRVEARLTQRQGNRALPRWRLALASWGLLLATGVALAAMGSLPWAPWLRRPDRPLPVSVATPVTDGARRHPDASPHRYPEVAPPSPSTRPVDAPDRPAAPRSRPSPVSSPHREISSIAESTRAPKVDRDLGIQALVFGKALSSLKDRESSQALFALNGYLSQFPRGVFADQAFVLRGELLVAGGHCRAAIRDFDAGLALKADLRFEERALMGRASCRLQIGDGAGGRRDLREYLARFPGGSFIVEAQRLLGAHP